MSEEPEIERVDAGLRRFSRGPEFHKFVERVYQEASAASKDGKAVRFRCENQRELESMRSSLQRRARLEGRRAHTESGNNGYLRVWIDLSPLPAMRQRRG